MKPESLLILLDTMYNGNCWYDGSPVHKIFWFFFLSIFSLRKVDRGGALCQGIQGRAHNSVKTFKERDRCFCLVKALSAHTEPVLLSHGESDDIDQDAILS